MHYSGYIDKLQYKIPYIDIFGWKVAFTAEIFEKINGYSNEYWGWPEIIPVLDEFSSDTACVMP